MSFNFETLFETKQNKINTCLFLKTMNAYSSFFEIIIKSTKREIDLLKIKNKIKNEKLKTELLNEIEYLNEYKSQIENNNYFLIPYSSKTIKTNYSETKTNVCKRCKYNCHLNCNDTSFLKRFCKCFDWGGNCKVCPNKCSIDVHEIVNYRYPNIQYKTIEHLLEKEQIENYPSTNALKLNCLIKKKNNQIKDCNEIINKSELEWYESFLMDFLNLSYEESE